MKKIILLTVLSVTTMLTFIKCEKNENTVDNNPTKVALSQEIPYYSDVLKSMEECGYIALDKYFWGEEFIQKLPSGFTDYSIYFCEKTGEYFIPICYDIDDTESIFKAMRECNRTYSETYDKEGNKYITCNGQGNSCHLEISVVPGGTDIRILIVTCQ